MWSICAPYRLRNTDAKKCRSGDDIVRELTGTEIEPRSPAPINTIFHHHANHRMMIILLWIVRDSILQTSLLNIWG